MKVKLTLSFVICLLLFAGNLLSQSNTVTAGGTANGSGGSATYTVGQTFYSRVDGNPNYLIEGMQQPYEISEQVSVEQFNKISLTLSAYPNPTSDILTLSRTLNEEVLTAVLFDASGKEISSHKMTETLLEIEMETFAKGTYYLNVTSPKNQLIKSFKILKN